MFDILKILYSILLKICHVYIFILINLSCLYVYIKICHVYIFKIKSVMFDILKILYSILFKTTVEFLQEQLLHSEVLSSEDLILNRVNRYFTVNQDRRANPYVNNFTKNEGNLVGI